MVHLILLSVHSAIIIRFFGLSQFSIFIFKKHLMCLQCTHIHTLGYLRISHSLIIIISKFAEQSCYDELCGDVIVRISGDQGKKDESLVTHMLSYMYIHVHFRSQIQSVHVCVCIFVWKDKWR